MKNIFLINSVHISINKFFFFFYKKLKFLALLLIYLNKISLLFKQYISSLLYKYCKI